MKLQQLKEEILRCRECEELFGYEPHPVFLDILNLKLCRLVRRRLCWSMKQESHLMT